MPPSTNTRQVLSILLRSRSSKNPLYLRSSAPKNEEPSIVVLRSRRTKNRLSSNFDRWPRRTKNPPSSIFGPEDRSEDRTEDGPGRGTPSSRNPPFDQPSPGSLSSSGVSIFKPIFHPEDRSEGRDRPSTYWTIPYRTYHVPSYHSIPRHSLPQTASGLLTSGLTGQHKNTKLYLLREPTENTNDYISVYFLVWRNIEIQSNLNHVIRSYYILHSLSSREPGCFVNRSYVII